MPPTRVQQQLPFCALCGLPPQVLPLVDSYSASCVYLHTGAVSKSTMGEQQILLLILVLVVVCVACVVGATFMSHQRESETLDLAVEKSIMVAEKALAWKTAAGMTGGRPYLNGLTLAKLGLEIHGQDALGAYHNEDGLRYRLRYPNTPAPHVMVRDVSGRIQAQVILYGPDSNCMVVYKSLRSAMEQPLPPLAGRPSSCVGW